jgi:hypothetical protein
MRAIYRVLALLIALSVVFQAAVLSYGWFQVLNEVGGGAVLDKNGERNVGHTLHGVFGVFIIPAMALLLLIVSFVAKIPAGVKWAGITFGVTVLQVLLAFVSFGVPVLGVLHGVTAFALAGVASIAARTVRTAPAPATSDAPAPAAAL